MMVAERNGGWTGGGASINNSFCATGGRVESSARAMCEENGWQGGPSLLFKPSDGNRRSRTVFAERVQVRNKFKHDQRAPGPFSG